METYIVHTMRDKFGDEHYEIQQESRKTWVAKVLTKEDADMIVAALNATYGSSIAPSSVDFLYRMLQEVSAQLKTRDGDNLTSRAIDVILEQSNLTT